MKLYGAPTPAPNPRRVRIFLAEKGIDLPETPVDLAKREHKCAGTPRPNSLGQVPTLELDDGETISETVAICRYFEEMQPEPSAVRPDGGREGAGRHVGAARGVPADGAGGRLLAPRPPAHRRPAHPVQGLRRVQPRGLRATPSAGWTATLEGPARSSPATPSPWPTSAPCRRWTSPPGSAFLSILS